MADTSVYTVAQLASIKASNDDYLSNKFMYRELNKIKMLVLGNNLLYGPGSNYTVYTYTSVADKDYFALLLQKLQLMFPDSYIYYTRNSNSNTLSVNSLRYISASDTYTASVVSITNVLFISQREMDIPLNNPVTIGTPLNVTYAPINNRICWEIKGNTTFTFNQSFPATQINFVAVGGGQSLIGTYSTQTPSENSGYGGNGGGVVYGAFNISKNYTLTITIGSSDMPTTISGEDINIIANKGINNFYNNIFLDGMSVTGSKIISSNIQYGGNGGGINNNSINGSNGPFIADLGLYVAGGGALIMLLNYNYYSLPNFQYLYEGGVGGNAGGGNSFSYNSNALANTGGGGGIGYDTSMQVFIGGKGGSGVVYLYI